MTKRRGRKAAASKPKPKGRGAVRSGTAKTSARPPRRPVDPDDDVFIPRSGVAGNTKTLKASTDDDDEVFVPKPMLQQADWVKDVGAPVDAHPRDPSIWEPFAGVRPRAGSPVGWSTATLYAHGLEVKKNRDGFRRVVCRYGCSGTTANLVGVSHHSHDCPYWTREGMKHSPF